MKPIVIILFALLILLQYQLWWAPSGAMSTIQLKKDILQQIKMNETLNKRNALMTVEIKDLKSGNAAIEERARNDLGMVKQGETFYQVVR